MVPSKGLRYSTGTARPLVQYAHTTVPERIQQRDACGDAAVPRTLVGLVSSFAILHFSFCHQLLGPWAGHGRAMLLQIACLTTRPARTAGLLHQQLWITCAHNGESDSIDWASLAHHSRYSEVI